MEKRHSARVNGVCSLLLLVGVLLESCASGSPQSKPSPIPTGPPLTPGVNRPWGGQAAEIKPVVPPFDKGPHAGSHCIVNLLYTRAC
jgi:hypothetical protein